MPTKEHKKQFGNELGEIRESLVRKDFAAAKKMLGEYIDRELTKEERGEIYTQLILLYIDTVNETNEMYRKSLEQAIEATKRLKTEETKMVDKFKTLEIKHKLQEIDDLD